METYEELKHQISYYKDKQIAVHIEKNNGRYYNGIILEVEGDMLILNDEKLGAIPIYFIEINFLEKREAPREKEENHGHP